MPGDVFAIKVRLPGESKFYFLASGGKLNALKIHALRFYERETAQTVIDSSAAANPGTEWKVVTL